MKMKAKMAFSGMVQDGKKKPEEVVVEQGEEREDDDLAVTTFPEMWEGA
jgi:hypothetical protein